MIFLATLPCLYTVYNIPPPCTVNAILDFIFAAGFLMMRIMREQTNFPRCAAVVPAAGLSSRMGGRVRKPYLRLEGLPLLCWTLRSLARLPRLGQIVLVLRPADRERAVKVTRAANLPRKTKIDFAVGGRRRQDSVASGLRNTSEQAEVVLIHDAARPFPPLPAMKKAVRAAVSEGAAILAIPVRDTVKRMCLTPSATPVFGKQAEFASVRIERTVQRDRLWLAQTPQVIRRDLALNLFDKLDRREKRTGKRLEFTDDAAVCEYFKQPVVLIESEYSNIKITTKKDLQTIKSLLRGGAIEGVSRPSAAI